MTIGNLVVVLANPMLWGAGQIRAITDTGRMIVEFADLSRDSFDPQELELLAKWQQGPCTVTDDDLKQLAA